MLFLRILKTVSHQYRTIIYVWEACDSPWGHEIYTTYIDSFK